ncbi:unnamed protein product, partial [Iphiclides podalirius]
MPFPKSPCLDITSDAALPSGRGMREQHHYSSSSTTPSRLQWTQSILLLHSIHLPHSQADRVFENAGKHVPEPTASETFDFTHTCETAVAIPLARPGDYVLLMSITQNLYVKCTIPDLSVQKLDSKLIQRKRQDTVDMCRIFNEETARLEQLNNARKSNRNRNINNSEAPNHRRMKRNVNSPYPGLKDDDKRRIENIVDKLYDDMEGNGQKVTYRQRRFSTMTTEKAVVNTTARRFHFAPAELLGPETTLTLRPDEPIEGKISWHKHWKHGIVPYFIDPNTYDSLLADTIIKAFDYFEKASCIRLQRLRERPTDKMSLQNVEWLYISNPYGLKQCVHSNERKANSGVQMVVFGYECLSLGEIVHEVMHILGFSHEHTRPDRDQYVTIIWDNIKPGYKKYFAIRPDDPLLSLSYDYASVLHYPARAFSKNGQSTVLTNSNVKIGQREGLSETDVQKIGIVYGRECVERNRQYLLKTCPSVVKRDREETKKPTQDEIEEYFKDRLWPYGIVNYRMRDRLEFSAEERENLKAVIRHIEKETCIQFRELTYDSVQAGEPAYTTTKSTVLETTPAMSDNEIKENDSSNEESGVQKSLTPTVSDYGQGINSDVVEPPTETTSRRHAANIMILSRSPKPGCVCPPPGRPNGNKILEISSDCFNSVNELLHLFVHVLGLDHQHNMHDRDLFLHIVWNNLTAEIGQEMQQKLPPAAAVGFPYDYQSVMHYPWLQITNGVTNIMYPIWNDGWAMGHWQGLSATDVQKLNLIYARQCDQRTALETINDD